MWRRKEGQRGGEKHSGNFRLWPHAGSSGAASAWTLPLPHPSACSILPRGKERSVVKKISQPRRLAGQQVQLELLTRDIKKINPSPSNHSARKPYWLLAGKSGALGLKIPWKMHNDGSAASHFPPGGRWPPIALSWAGAGDPGCPQSRGCFPLNAFPGGRPRLLLFIAR